MIAALYRKVAAPYIRSPHFSGCHRTNTHSVGDGNISQWVLVLSPPFKLDRRTPKSDRCTRSMIATSVCRTHRSGSSPGWALAKCLFMSLLSLKSFGQSLHLTLASLLGFCRQVVSLAFRALILL